jgi:hypothetical protein
VNWYTLIVPGDDLRDRLEIIRRSGGTITSSRPSQLGYCLTYVTDHPL